MDLRSPYFRGRKRVFAEKSVEAVPDADWQSGRTDDNYALRPLLDGEPISGAYAAKSGLRGWIAVRPAPESAKDVLKKSILLRGRVTIVPIPASMQ